MQIGGERAKKSSTAKELEMGGVSAIAKQEKVFGVPHKEMKSHVSRVKKLLVACELHFVHP